MFGASATTKNDMQRVAKAAEQAQFRNFGHAANRIMKDDKESIITSSEPSAPGSPPHTRGNAGHNYRSAVRYDATKDDAVVGYIASMVGQSARAHELGEEIHGEEFAERPSIVPAMLKNVDRFADSWKGSITE